MDFLRTLTGQRAQAPPAASSTGMDHGEEMIAEVDEPPDKAQSQRFPLWSPPKFQPPAQYTKPATHGMPRRESLLTRQLHSGSEHTDDEEHEHTSIRALSTQSTWSNQSTTSTAELTSDDGRSVPSPAISPPLPPTHFRTALPIHDKPLDKHIKIGGQEDKATSHANKETSSENSVEAGLGRKRCISFACGRKGTAPVVSPPRTSVPQPPVESSPPKRKCMLKFACPTRSGSETKVVGTTPAKRAVSPLPPERTPSITAKAEAGRSHRGSDSTVIHSSPKSIRKSQSTTISPPLTATAGTPKPCITRKATHESDDSGSDAPRFCEFGMSEDEPEEWVKESTCHRNRLTVSDTLKKENVIRKACEEVEDEAIEEEEEEEAEAEEEEEAAGAELAAQDDGNDDKGEASEESDGSDAGFHSDDEEGFAASDDEGEESDFEWWKPSASTAATSVEPLDRFALARAEDVVPASSIGSVSSGRLSPHTRHRFYKGPRRHTKSEAMPIHRPVDADLPDSTDFVCGTLDEDRPLEQAFINRKKQLEAAKHRARPQDIDPSFPASDPEMDEEDDEDLEDPEESEREDLVHGELEELDHTAQPLKRRPSPAPRRTTNPHRSPPPPARLHSPPPSKRRNHSPPPLVKRGTARSPPPPPPPPPSTLFGHSPKHIRSPPPVNPMTSPPNTRDSSPVRPTTLMTAPHGLAARPQLTHTASLPRGGGGGFLRGMMAAHDDDAAADGTDVRERSKRGAIDIVKGLEKKRQRRKEKLYQKMCLKAAAKGDKAYKVKPGKGAERMREVGLELQRYKGKGEHILSM